MLASWRPAFGWVLVLVLTAPGSSLLSCGGDGRPGPDSGLDGTKPVKSLPETDEKTLCDWTAGRIGGWNRTITCSDGAFLKTAADEATCISKATASAAMSGCSTLTVNDFEDCVNDFVDGCSSLPAACQFLLGCGMMP